MADLPGMMARTEVLIGQRRYKDAEAILRQILEQDPNNDASLARLGLCYLNTDRQKEGKEVIRKAIALDPEEPHYYYLLGFAEYRTDNHLEAITLLEKAVNLDPYEAEYFGMLGHAYLAERLYEPALAKADEGLAVDPENITCLSVRSLALNKLRRTADAIDTIQTALSYDPNNELTHVTAGYNYLEKGKHKEANRHFMEALRESPDSHLAKEGLKQALKSRIPPYRWLLQYSYWVSGRGRQLRMVLPIALYIIFRVAVYAFDTNESTQWIAFLLAGIYILILVMSWTVNSIANFVLMFHPLGKHALTYTERVTALSSVPAFVAGLILLAVYFLVPGLSEYEGIFFSALIFISLALPLGRVDYPVRRSELTWRNWYTLGLIATGILCLICWAFLPAFAAKISAFYLIAFLIYTWVGG